MVDREDSVEEKVVTRRVAKPKGVRLWFSLAMVVLGAGLVAIGAFGVSTAGVRVVLIVAGVALIFGFGWVVVGGSRVQIEGSPDGGIKGGVDMPQDTTVRTTIRKRGFPRRGRMPPKHGTMPRKEGDPPRDPDDPSSGAAG
jgi:hypothetical protein